MNRDTAERVAEVAAILASQPSYQSDHGAIAPVPHGSSLAARSNAYLGRALSPQDLDYKGDTMTARPQATPAHTPGPWQYMPAILTVGFRCAAGIRSVTDGYYVATLVDGPDPLTEANARLIAQAPALLAALENMAGQFQYHNPGGTTKPQGEALAEARAAIAAARGGAE